MPFTPTRRALRRAATLAGAAALFAGLAAAPAMADEGRVDLSVEIPAYDDGGGRVVGLPLDGGRKDLRVDVRNNADSTVTATNVVLHFKLPAATDAGSITLAADLAAKCTVNGDGTGTCDLGDIAPGSIRNLRAFTVTSNVTEIGDTPERIGQVSVSVTADQPERDEADNSSDFAATVLLDKGFDMAVWVRGTDLVVRPGESGVLDGDDFAIENDSASKAVGLQFSIMLPQHMRVAHLPLGCGFTDDDNGEKRSIQCDLPEATVAGHAKYALPGGLSYTVDADAPARAKLKGGVVAWAIANALEGAGTPEGGEPVLALSAPSVSAKAIEEHFEDDSSGQDNAAEFAVFTREDTADLAVAATTPDTTVGGQTTAKVTVTNNGPWAIDESYTVTFTAPTGTTVLTAPTGCAAEGSTYKCVVTGTFDKGATKEFSFVLRADVEKIGADGVVKVSSGQPDAVAANNTAAITFKVTAGPTQSPTPSPTDGGGLPTTGAGLTLMGLVAAALLAAGAVFVIIARRKRARTTGGEY